MNNRDVSGTGNNKNQPQDGGINGKFGAGGRIIPVKIPAIKGLFSPLKRIRMSQFLGYGTEKNFQGIKLFGIIIQGFADIPLLALVLLIYLFQVVNFLFQNEIQAASRDKN